MASATNDVLTDQETTSDIQYRIASTRREREAAFRLVYHSYLRAGLGDQNCYRMRVTPYHLLESTEVFVAKCNGEVIFTLSLIMDGELGMPMESVYAGEVDELRGRGLRLGEVSCLADRRADACGFFPVFVRTSRLMVQYARHRGLDALVAAVHPKHARFYRRYMDFRMFGQEKTYPTVRNNPAVALWLEFTAHRPGTTPILRFFLRPTDPVRESATAADFAGRLRVFSGHDRSQIPVCAAGRRERVRTDVWSG